MRTSDWSSDVCSSDLMAEDDVAFVDQPQRVLEHFVGFGRKARDQVRAKGYIGPRLAHPRAEIDRLPAVVPALHSFQDHVVAGLQRQEIGRASCRERVCQYV